jgi:hypothetical protein
VSPAPVLNLQVLSGCDLQLCEFSTTTNINLACNQSLSGNPSEDGADALTSIVGQRR